MGVPGRADVTVLPAWTGPPMPTAAGGNRSPALSPDGRHAAYVSDRGGTPRVYVQPVGRPHTFAVDLGDDPVTGVWWSTGGGWLAVATAPGGAPRHEVWLVRPDGSQPHRVAGHGTATAENPRWLPGRPLLAVTEDLSTALLVDAVTGRRETVATGELISLCDVSLDRRRALLRHGPRGARHLAVHDLVTGKRTVVGSGERGVFGPDGEVVYVVDDGGEFPVLTGWHAGTRTVLAGRGGAEVEDVALTGDGARAAVLWNVRGGLSALDVVDLRTGAVRPVAPLPAPVVSEPVWSADGTVLAFTAEGPGRPHGVWAADAAGVHPVAVEPAEPGAAAPVLETVVAADGLELTGWLFRPPGAGPHPAVLWLHGGPEAQERPGHNPLFQSLVDRGVAVFAPNVRGSSGFGRTFLHADTGARRHAAIDDVAACARHLVDTGTARPGRLGCAGRSYGGYLTLAALTRYPDLFAVGVDVCGMADFATFFAHTEPWIAAAAVGKYGDPVADAALLRDLSPVHRIDALRAPLLVVHGANDTNVPVGEAEQVVAALARRGVPHRYLLFPGEGHELLHRAAREEFLRVTVEWLTTHLT